MREAAQLNAVFQSSGEISCRYGTTTKHQANMAFTQGTAGGLWSHQSWSNSNGLVDLGLDLGLDLSFDLDLDLDLDLGLDHWP